MPIWKSNDAQDGGADFVATCTLMSLVSDTGTPTDLTNTIASVSVAPADFSIADGTGSRVLTIAAKPGITASASGTGNHVVLSLDGVLHSVSTVTTPEAIASGDTVNFPAWTDTFVDPVEDI